MKKLIVLIAVVSVFIIAVMIHLIRDGVIVRPQPLIKPTIIQADFSIVPEHLFMRLFPEFQSVNYVLWRIDLPPLEKKALLSQVQKLVESQAHQLVQWISSNLEIQNCVGQCWMEVAIEVPVDQAKIEFEKQNKKGIQIRIFQYSHLEPLSESCEHQKILNEECLYSVGLNLAKKKLKDPQARYFFMQKYLDQDFYLFVKKVN